MAFTFRQKTCLHHVIEHYRRNTTSIRLQVNILPYRRYTREFGKGIDVVVCVYECYEEADYRMLSHHISNVQDGIIAEDKGKAIARYLVAAGAPKDKIRLRRGKPEQEIRKEPCL